MDRLESTDPATICEALRHLSRNRPTPKSIAAVEAKLESKFESVQSLAAQVLATWQSHGSLPKLRAAFERLTSEKGYGQRKTLAKAMGALLQPKDTKQIIDWFLALPTYNERYDLLPTVACVDPKRATPLLERAWAVGDPQLKHSILVAASEMRLPWKFIPLGQRDSDSHVRKVANDFAKTWEHVKPSRN